MNYLDLMDTRRILRVIEKNNKHFTCKVFWLDPKTNAATYGGKVYMPRSLFLSGNEDPRSPESRVGFMPFKSLA